MKCAKIALSAATFAIDLPYTYRVPLELEKTMRPGIRVAVPFGTGNRLSEGLVVSDERPREDRHRPSEHPLHRSVGERLGEARPLHGDRRRTRHVTPQ